MKGLDIGVLALVLMNLTRRFIAKYLFKPLNLNVEALVILRIIAA